jgi:Ceramidase
MDRDPRPIAIAGATTVVSCALLAVAIGRGWLGADVGRGANFCEAGRDWVVRQPANTFSNVGFVVAGLLIAWHAGARRSAAVLMARPHLATAMACLVVLLGPGSAAMHATQSALGGHLDLLSMYLVAAFAAAYAATRWARGDAPLLAALFIGGVACCEFVGSWPLRLPVVNHPGNAAFGLLLAGATAIEVLILRRGETRARRAYAYASLAAILTAFAIWNATKTWLCDPDSLIQGHAIWHLLGAVSAYFLYRYYASEETIRPASAQVSSRASDGSPAAPPHGMREHEQVETRQQQQGER